VYAVPDGEGSSVILSSVTLREGSATSGGDLLRYVRDRLPAYALPREVFVERDLPRTTSGKVDRGRLEELHLKQGRS
jgi:acyl-coenzyme A synthetase/AMP-(fatty) acid ligase